MFCMIYFALYLLLQQVVKNVITSDMYQRINYMHITKNIMYNKYNICISQFKQFTVEVKSRKRENQLNFFRRSNLCFANTFNAVV